MQSYEGSFTGADNVKKGGSTQPMPMGSDGMNPGGTGAIPAVVGKTTPIVVPTGATNDGE